MTKSLQTSLLENIRQNYPQSQGLNNLLALGTSLGHKDSLTERKLRLLVASGLVEVLKDAKGQNYAYKATGWTNENIAEVFSKAKKEIKEKYGDFLGLDKNLKPVYSKEQGRLGILLPPVRS